MFSESKKVIFFKHIFDSKGFVFLIKKGYFKNNNPLLYLILTFCFPLKHNDVHNGAKFIFPSFQ